MFIKTRPARIQYIYIYKPRAVSMSYPGVEAVGRTSDISNFCKLSLIGPSLRLRTNAVRVAGSPRDANTRFLCERRGAPRAVRHNENGHWRQTRNINSWAYLRNAVLSLVRFRVRFIVIGLFLARIWSRSRPYTKCTRMDFPKLVLVDDRYGTRITVTTDKLYRYNTCNVISRQTKSAYLYK